MTTAIYRAVYGGYDTVRPQPVPVRTFTDETHPRPESDPRQAAKWWKFRPDLACPDADVTVWIDGSIDVLRPDFAELCTDALGDADALFVRHQSRDDIYEEAEVSLTMTKYQGWPLREQVEYYRAYGHPEHWGLAHAALIVRRLVPEAIDLGQAWWAEVERWSLQDQLSLPPLLRVAPLNWRWFDESPFELGWASWSGAHALLDVPRKVAA